MNDRSNLRVFILGNDSPGNGGDCYAQSLRRMGHMVEHVNDWIGLGHYSRGYTWRVYRHLTASIWPRHQKAYARDIAGRISDFGPNLFIALGGLHLTHENIREIRSQGIWTCNLNHDDFRSRYRLNKSRIQWEAIPAYDQILTTRECNVDEIRPLNPNVEFFQFAYDPRVHRPVPIPEDEREPWCVDVVFVGTYAPQRARLMERLVQAVPASYAIHGDWSKLATGSPLRPYVRKGNIFRDDLCKAIGGAKIALGFLRKENRDDYTQRTFEIPACGGLMLMERTARQTSWYREGYEAEFFDPDHPTELIEKVRSLLADPQRRERIRAAGLTAVKSMPHTYDDRIHRLLTLFAAAQPSTPVFEKASG